MAKVQKNAQSTKENTVFLLFLIATPHFECDATFIPIAKWREGSKIKTWGRREGESLTLTCPHSFVHRPLRPMMWKSEGHFRMHRFLHIQCIPQKSHCLFAITATKARAQSVGFGLAVRSVRTGSPSRRTKFYTKNNVLGSGYEPNICNTHDAVKHVSPDLSWRDISLNNQVHAHRSNAIFISHLKGGRLVGWNL